jgi:hypothetical protein
MIDIDSRLRVSRGIAKTETEASEKVFRTLRQNRGHPETPPPTISDGWGGIREAMVQTWGKVPEYKGRGRPPEKKRPLGGWKYLQVIKDRDERGRVNGTKKEVVFGEEESVLELFEDHTAYVERTHLTMRQMNSRLIRKGLGFSKELPMHRAAARWEDAVYNLTRTHKSLRIDLTGPLNGQPGHGPGRRWKRQTPAMAAGLTEKVWSTEELLRVVPTTNT